MHPMGLLTIHQWTWVVEVVEDKVQCLEEERGQPKLQSRKMYVFTILLLDVHILIDSSFLYSICCLSTLLKECLF